MHISIHRALDSRIFLKVSSLIIAYLLWSIIGESFSTTRWYQIPIVFYNIEENIKLTAPEYIWIQMKSKRSILSNIDTDNLALHINAQELKTGPNNVTVNEETLLLSANICVSNFIPQNVIVNKLSIQ